MRKTTIAGVIVLCIGTLQALRPILGPTVVSSALDREGVAQLTPAEDCRSGSRTPQFSLYGYLPSSDRAQVHIDQGGHDALCIPGPECGLESSEVLLFPAGNGLFYQCRARSALGVLTPQERADMIWAVVFVLLGLALTGGPRLRDTMARRRWDAIDRPLPGPQPVE